MREDFSFCEPCVQGKSHCLPFQQSSVKRTDHPLKLIHSDVCRKIGTRSLGGGEYFITFLDDHTRHVWVYIIKNKSEVFQRFRESKAQVERSSGKRSRFSILTMEESMPIVSLPLT